MSDNIRTALYDADYSLHAGHRGVRGAAALTRVVGKHCEAGDIVVKDEFLPADVAPGDLLAVPGHRRLLPVDGQPTTTTRCARRWSRCGTARSRVVVRRETMDDLLRHSTWRTRDAPDDLRRPDRTEWRDEPG